MTLAAKLREALEQGHRQRPVLIAGDVLEGEDVERGLTPAAVLMAATPFAVVAGLAGLAVVFRPRPPEA